MMEVEYKFAISKNEIQSVKQNSLITHYCVKIPKKVNVRNIYFDTSNFILYKNRFALRLRKNGQTIIQTLKKGIDSQEGLSRRLEWENEIHCDEIQINKLPSEVQLLLNQMPLIPIFTNDIEREIFNLQLKDNTKIEMVIDEGYCEVSHLREPISELELEFKSGCQESFDAFVQQLKQELNLIPETRGKAERGYALYEHAQK